MRGTRTAAARRGKARKGPTARTMDARRERCPERASDTPTVSTYSPMTRPAMISPSVRWAVATWASENSVRPSHISRRPHSELVARR